MIAPVYCSPNLSSLVDDRWDANIFILFNIPFNTLSSVITLITLVNLKFLRVGFPSGTIFILIYLTFCKTFILIIVVIMVIGIENFLF